MHMKEKNLLKRAFNKLFIEEEWAIGYRIIAQNEELPANNAFYSVWMPTQRYWFADPFLFENNGRMYIFCEAMDLLDGLGKIGVAEIIVNEIQNFRIVLKLNCHTSYPCVFKIKNEIYMIPETTGNKTIELYKATNFPDKWVLEKKLLSNIDAPDTTVHATKSGIFLYVYDRKEEAAILDIYKLDVFLLELKKLDNVSILKDDKKQLRPAGNFLTIDGKIFRPSQEGTRNYGEFININEVHNIDSIQYFEEKKYEIRIANIRTNKNIKFVKTHTINRLGIYEVVDLFFYKFTLKKPMMIISRLINRRNK